MNMRSRRENIATIKCSINVSEYPHYDPRPKNEGASLPQESFSCLLGGWGGEGPLPCSQASRLAFLYLGGLPSVPTFTSPLAPAPRILLPNLRFELHFFICNSGLITVPHPSSQGWKKTYGEVFWRQSCCLMKMTRLRLKFLLPDVEAWPSHVPESWGGAGCPELSILQLSPDLPCWDPVPSPCHKRRPSEGG